MANEQESYIIDFSHTPLPHSKHEDVQMDGLMEQNPDRAARVQQWATNRVCARSDRQGFGTL